jgi:hypothetical protein
MHLLHLSCDAGSVRLTWSVVNRQITHLTKTSFLYGEGFVQNADAAGVYGEQWHAMFEDTRYAHRSAPATICSVRSILTSSPSTS